MQSNESKQLAVEVNNNEHLATETLDSGIQVHATGDQPSVQTPLHIKHTLMMLVPQHITVLTVLGDHARTKGFPFEHCTVALTAVILFICQWS